MERTSTLFGHRVMLRPIVLSDFAPWREVRQRCGEWLTMWEPRRLPHQADATQDRDAFALRCSARQRERQLGTGFGFGIFTEGQFCGEINLSSIQRGPFQSAYVGYWIDQERAGQGLMPEALVVLARFAFDDIHLHRVQVSIIPRNTASRRVVDKLGLRQEGIAEKYLEINGVWEDHIRYALTAEEWEERRHDLEAAWLTPRTEGPRSGQPTGSADWIR
ncbi:MAG: GNAT family N-acetyltransferase [Acidimicrobiia bacterium]|nr:GNAT family N-acetyltransferase [Acidimicrobiia bacterium]